MWKTGRPMDLEVIYHERATRWENCYSG